MSRSGTSAAMLTPELQVLPGLDGTTRLLTPFLAAARTAGFARAAGIAYPPDRVLTYAALEVFARDRLPRDAPFVLLGESFSGPIAIAIAADPPPNLRALVLSTTFARAPVPSLSPFAPLTRFAPVRTLPMAALSLALLGRWSTPELRRDLRTALDTVAPAVLRARAATAMRADVSSRLPRIAVPTLILRANHDRLLHAGTIRPLMDGIAGAREHAIDGPHLLLQTRSAYCAGRVADFLADCVADPAVRSDAGGG